jgi:hypothetical protein
VFIPGIGTKYYDKLECGEYCKGINFMCKEDQLMCSDSKLLFCVHYITAWYGLFYEKLIFIWLGYRLENREIDGFLEGARDFSLSRINYTGPGASNTDM